MLLTPYLFCFLSSIPGLPPGIKFEDAYIQLFPVDKTKCNNIHPITDIRFEVTTPKNPTVTFRTPIGDDEALLKSGIDFRLPTVIYFHAFFEDSMEISAQVIRSGFLARGDHNLIVVHAPKLLAGPWYLTAVRNTGVLGKYTARFVDYLVTRGLNLKYLHLIGLSLGGQTAGVCGHYVKGRVARITALDPAGPLFGSLPPQLRLDPGDADFVSVIHTDAGVFGIPDAAGHADFWPNGGVKKQPGCLTGEVAARNPGMIFEKIFCSHWRSFQYYAESIAKENAFLAINCDTFEDFKARRCNESTIIPMGFQTPTTARGNYYLVTNKNPPYSRTF